MMSMNDVTLSLQIINLNLQIHWKMTKTTSLYLDNNRIMATLVMLHICIIDYKIVQWVPLSCLMTMSNTLFTLSTS